MLALMISDVPGDDPSLIGSGPTLGEAPAALDVAEALERWNLNSPEAIRRALLAPSRCVPEGDPRLSRVRNRIIAAPAQSLSAAADLACASGCRVEVLGCDLEGEARSVAARHAALALKLRQDRHPGDPPLLLLSGGELTVTRKGRGIGGPNAEYALALGLALNGAEGVHAIACDTDGVDGGAEVAGAVLGPDMLSLARARGIDPQAALQDNDAHGFFAAIGGQVITGPTLTNVNDFRAILISGPA
jgi:hydroxypyruvate reductase